MPKEKSAPRPSSIQDGDFPGRSIVSLLLVIHLFTVAVVLSANLEPNLTSRSPLLHRLASILRPYAGTLHFDPDRVPYHLAYPSPLHDDHVIEVDLLESGQVRETIRLSNDASRAGNSFQRHKALARLLAVMAYLPDNEGDPRALAIARAIGRHVMDEHDVQAVTVRCLHRRPASRVVEPNEAAQNPADPLAGEYFQAIYEANVLYTGEGRVEGLKILGPGEVAPPQGT